MTFMGVRFPVLFVRVFLEKGTEIKLRGERKADCTAASERFVAAMLYESHLFVLVRALHIHEYPLSQKKPCIRLLQSVSNGKKILSPLTVTVTALSFSATIGKPKGHSANPFPHGAT
jgi:hypothetical protein